MKGVQSNGNKYCVWYRNGSLGSWLANYIRSQTREITLATGVYRRARFRSCGTVGYGPTMWANSRKGGWRFAQSCKQGMSENNRSVFSATTSVPRARDEENHFPARWTRRTNRQSSRPSAVTGMSSTKITGSYWQNCTPRCLHKQGILMLRSYRSQERLNQTMEGKYVYQSKQNNGKENVLKPFL